MLDKDVNIIENNMAFTQLFSILKSNITKYDEMLIKLNTEESENINFQIDHAIKILLQGLSSINFMIDSIGYADRRMIQAINHLKFFGSLMINLIEALEIFRPDNSSNFH